VEVETADMSSDTSSKVKIEIDLNQREEAWVLNSEQLIQREAIDKFIRLVKDALACAKDYKKRASSSEEKPFVRMRDRGHNTITLNGSRGSGKTTLLNSLISKFVPGSNKGDKAFSLLWEDSLADSVYALGVIDPNLVETKEHVLVTIISLIRKDVLEKLVL
jgi:Cdc6-like AAA superfamily ATPase